MVNKEALGRRILDFMGSDEEIAYACGKFAEGHAMSGLSFDQAFAVARTGLLLEAARQIIEQVPMQQDEGN